MPAASQDSQFTKLIYGRHLALAGDAESVAAGTTGYALLLGESGGGVAATTRAQITKCAVGHNGAGAATLTGTLVGDTVISVTNLTTPGDVTSSFEATITVAGQIQQSAATNLSAAQLLYVVRPQS